MLDHGLQSGHFESENRKFVNTTLIVTQQLTNSFICLTGTPLISHQISHNLSDCNTRWFKSDQQAKHQFANNCSYTILKSTDWHKP